jgi:omega-6 fatty acid desaturase (delta-12 desaturase)
MDLRTYTRQYATADNRLALLSYFGTLGVYFAALGIGLTQSDKWYLMGPAGVVFAFAAVRLYVLQHDTGHHSLFETRLQNEWAGHVLSPFTFAPFEVMKQNHNLHHANVGNLEHRETGEIFTMTVTEWDRAGWAERLFYRLYRNPFVLVPLGAAFTYFIRYRWPKNTMQFGMWQVLAHNLVILTLLYALDFGWVFDFAVANITLHDIHHFNARIPSYRLRQCHHNMPEEWGLRRIKFQEAIRALGLKLWDEESKRLVPFPK